MLTFISYVSVRDQDAVKRIKAVLPTSLQKNADHFLVPPASKEGEDSSVVFIDIEGGNVRYDVAYRCVCNDVIELSNQQFIELAWFIAKRNHNGHSFWE